MYEEVFEEFQLTVVELPIEFVDDLPVYRGHLKRINVSFSGSLFTKKLYQQLLQAYLLYREENQAVVEEEEITSSLLSTEQLLKYYDGETFDGFQLPSNE